MIGGMVKEGWVIGGLVKGEGDWVIGEGGGG